MHNHYTVLGGWGIPPEVLQPVFGNRSVYIDCNNLLPSVVTDENLSADWLDTLCAYLQPKITDKRLLAGWSTGAIIAAACASRLNVRALVLISVTPSFCRKSTFRHGMRPSILHTMRKRLSIDPTAVIADFRQQCGLSRIPPDPQHPWSTEALSAGLTALEQISISDRIDTHIPTQIFHGIHDRIIPIAAAEFFNTRCGGSMIALDGGHACFINNTTTMQTAITNFDGGIKNGTV